MKAKALTVHWHQDNQPIYSAHFQPHTDSKNRRLATCGGDNNVRLWRLEYEPSNPSMINSVTYLATLSKHTQAVNVVRFDPKGCVLASAGDDGAVLLWTPSMVEFPGSSASNVGASSGPREFGTFGSEDVDKESWKLRHTCRSSISEIYDLAWSPDSEFLIAGSMDNVSRVYNASNGQCIRQLAEHSHYVQGVAWDPLNEFIATQSSDRSVHIYNLKTKDGQFALGGHHKIARAELPVRLRAASPAASAVLGPPAFSANNHTNDATLPSSGVSAPTPSTPSTPMNPPPLVSQGSHSRKSSFGPHRSESPSPSSTIPLPAVRQIGSPGFGYRNTTLYHNESLTSFFRRLTFTPDGALLLTPSGVFRQNADSDESTNTVYIYTRAGLNRAPIAHLPGLKKPSLVIKCSPILYQLRDPKPTEELELPAKNDSHIKPSNSAQEGSAPQNSSSSSNSSPPPVFNLKYRMIYAVAMQDAVAVYDTQQRTPLCIVSNLHYAAFTDLAWSNDGNTLLMTSTDGFCSVIMFEPGELGVVYTESPTISTSLGSPSITSLSPSTLNPFSASSSTDSLIPVVSSIPLLTASSTSHPFSTPPHTPSFGPRSRTSSNSSTTRPVFESQDDSDGALSTSAPLPSSSNVSLSPATAATSTAATSTAATSTAEPTKKKRRIAPTLVPQG